MTTLRLTSCFILSLLLFSGCAALRDEPPERTVRVRVLADTKLRAKDPRWRETAGGLLRAASDFYEREFGIKLAAVQIDPWEFEEETPLVSTLLKALMKAYPPSAGAYDVAVGLTGQRVAFYAGGRGLALVGNCEKGLGDYLVSSVSEPYRYTGRSSEPTLDVVALIHEFGHIFGAEHTEDAASIMHIPFDYRSDFDPKSRSVVKKNKLCPFAK
jgi:Metallo-peptidase family M12